MDHSGMDHSMPMPDHGDMDMCSMNMLFTWDTTNLCVVFKWWHVRTNLDLLLTIVAVVALGAGYEYLRLVAKRFDARFEYSTAGKCVVCLFLTMRKTARRGSGLVGLGWVARPSRLGLGLALKARQ